MIKLPFFAQHASDAMEYLQALLIAARDITVLKISMLEEADDVSYGARILQVNGNWLMLRELELTAMNTYKEELLEFLAPLSANLRELTLCSIRIPSRRRWQEIFEVLANEYRLTSLVFRFDTVHERLTQSLRDMFSKSLGFRSRHHEVFRGYHCVRWDEEEENGAE